MAPKLYALIMAGGSGTRLWPRSQPHMPKQFLDFTGAGSLLQLAQQRLQPFIPAARTFVATHTDYRVLAHQQLRTVPAGNILAEPSARGTAAAIGLAALHIRCRDRPELRGVHVLERAAELANGGAGGPQNHNLARRLNYTRHLKKDDIKRMFKNLCVYDDFRTFARPLSPINISLIKTCLAFTPHF